MATETLISVHRFNNEPGQQILSHTGTPALAAFVLADILIAVSLCTLFYNNGSCSVFPRTKRLLNTLIIYTVNRCLLTLLVTIAQLVAVRTPYYEATMLLLHFLQSATHQYVWTVTLDFIIHGLYANSFLASLNARQYLQTQASSTVSDSRISTVDFAKVSNRQGYVESSDDGAGLFCIREEAVIGITADPSLGKVTALHREGEL
ncbi:hypothetical protein EDD16DRAFT_1680177 [Pisolithus croceorrhizus]|nr:hypothetical protein EDD16DRAFT_1680177 [Pisolithus croceorrhizus]